jgi:hypothetical protein
MSLNLHFIPQLAKTDRGVCKHCNFPGPLPLPRGTPKLVIEDWTGRVTQPFYSAYCSACAKTVLTDLIKNAYRAKRTLERLEKGESL